MTAHATELIFALLAAGAVAAVGHYFGRFLHWAEHRLTHHTIRPHVVTDAPVESRSFVEYRHVDGFPPPPSAQQISGAQAYADLVNLKRQGEREYQAAMAAQTQAYQNLGVQNSASALQGLGGLLSGAYGYNIQTDRHESRTDTMEPKP